MGNPCHGGLGPSSYTMIHVHPNSTSLLGLVIEGSEYFDSIDLTGQVLLLLTQYFFFWL
jgi:hypothetical protein